MQAIIHQIDKGVRYRKTSKRVFDLIYSPPPLEYLHNNIVSAHILNRLSLISMQSLGCGEPHNIIKRYFIQSQLKCSRTVGWRLALPKNGIDWSVVRSEK